MSHMAHPRQPELVVARSRLVREARQALAVVEEVRALNRPDVWSGRIPRSSREELDLLLRRLRAWVDEIASLA